VSDAETALRELFEAEEPHVISAYLFGSHAQARAHRESDVDIGVLLDWKAFPDAASRFEARLRLSSAIGRALGRRDVDVVVLNDAPPQLARAIMADGQLLFCRDAEAAHAHRRTVLSRAADLEPFLRRTRRTKLAAIRQ
jgi:predicted nucleotidyltransferase